MSTISSCYHFDSALLKQLIGVQRQIDHGIPVGALSALNTFQQNLQYSSQISTPFYLQTLNMLNDMQRQIPQIQTIVQSVQRIGEAWTPAVQTIIHQQYQNQTMIPYLETTMLDLIQSSYANLTRDVTVSALTDALETFTKVEIPEHDLSAEPSELSEEESAQLSAQLSEAVEDPQNWQQRMMAVIQAWKVRNPIVAGLVQLLVTTVISQLLWQSFCWGAAALRDSVIREKPAGKAAVVCQVKQGETVTVIGDAPYYYLVEVAGPNTDESLSGYISKKSVKSIGNDG